MKTAAFSFLAGAVAISGAVVCAGWHGFAAGVVFSLAAHYALFTAIGTRRLGMFILAMADSIDAAHKPAKSSGEDNTERDQVYSALRNMGEKPRVAAQLADQAVASGAKGFENLFRAAVAQRSA